MAKTNNKDNKAQEQKPVQETAAETAEKQETATAADNATTAETAPTAEELAAKVQAEIAEYKDMAQRIQAEFENYRRRTNDSVRLARQDGGNDVIMGILPVMDTVEIALKMVSDDKSKEGIALIYKQLQNLLKKYDVLEVEAEGKDFDPSFHNAVMQVEDKENEGKVIEVLQKGYQRNNKVIRYAMVKVAK